MLLPIVCSEGIYEAIYEGTVLDDGKWLGIPDIKLLGLILELGTLDPMIFFIIVGKSGGITVIREDGPWLVKMEVPSLGFVLTDILGNLESSAPLSSPDTYCDSLGISFPSLTGTSLIII